MACELQPVHICLRRGSTVTTPFRPESERWSWVQVQAVAATAPARITAPQHGVPDQWRGVLYNVAGMPQINALREPARLREADFFRFDRISADTLEVNALNAAGWQPGQGGQLAYRTPLDLTQFDGARMQVNHPDTGARLAYWSTEQNGGLSFDHDARAILLTLTAEESAALEWEEGVFDLELYTDAGRVENIVAPTSTIRIVPENTTDHP